MHYDTLMFSMKLKSAFLPVLLVVSLFAFPSLASAEACPNPSDNPCWVTKASMPTARRDHGVAVDTSGKIYVVGGYNGSFLNTLEVYDPSIDTWTTKASAPVGRNIMGFAYNQVNSKFYFGGGYNNGLHNDFYEYDPATDTWTQKVSMPTASGGLSLAAASNGKVYAIGGGFLDGSYVSNVEEYDPATDTWTIKSAIPTPRSDAGLVAAQNGKFYFIGGGAPGTSTSSVNEYDPITDVWVTKASLPAPRTSHAASLNVNGNIYVVGGYDTHGQFFNDTVYEYNIANDTWTTRTPFPVGINSARMGLGGDGKVYVVGGWTSSSEAVNTNYTGFVPDQPNQTPDVGSVTVSPNPVTVNTSVNASANFTDANAGDSHTATIDWGDGSGAQTCSVTESNGSGSVSCTKASGYAEANVYPVIITVSDSSLSGNSPVQYVSVYNPTQQSIFTAGHRFSSPIGAYPQNNTLTGNVTFGLSYRYQGSMPVGLRQFSMDFKAADLSFNATTISSLVIFNGKAILTGTGTINGAGSYDFLVVGVDGNGIRIKISDPSNNNTIIYDTQPGDPDTANPITPVTGAVIVH